MDDNEKTREQHQESYNKKIAKYWAELIEGGGKLEGLPQAELEKLILDYGPDEFLAELKLPLPRPTKNRKSSMVSIGSSTFGSVEGFEQPTNRKEISRAAYNLM